MRCNRYWAQAPGPIQAKLQASERPRGSRHAGCGYVSLRGGWLPLLAHLQHRDLRRPRSTRPSRRCPLCRPLPAVCSIRACAVRTAECEGWVPHLNASIDIGCVRLWRRDRLRKGIGRDLRHSNRSRAQVGSTGGRRTGDLESYRTGFRGTRTVVLMLVL